MDQLSIKTEIGDTCNKLRPKLLEDIHGVSIPVPTDLAQTLIESAHMSITSSDYQARFDTVTEHYAQDLSLIRTGRASAQMLDSVSVEAYGGKMRVAEVASVTVPDPTLIVISPWDKSLLSAIEKGIQVAGLNLNPIVDGQVIRLPVPSLTTERRQELVKLLQQKAESARVMVRTVRTEVKKEIEKQKGEPGVSEDHIEAELKELEDITKAMIEQVDAMTARKETELMTI